MAWQALLQFWFGQLTDGVADESFRKNWFAASADFDAQCRRFEPELKNTGKPAEDWSQEPRAQLALILLCDQIPRNIYRGTAEAFAWDHLALSRAKTGIEQGIDRKLAWDERAFFYMPFEHSESLVDQHTSVALFSRLRDEVPQAHRNMFGNILRFAQQHRDIILRFGRFPHRNAVLGRTSTEAEDVFARDSDGFGQKTR